MLGIWQPWTAVKGKCLDQGVNKDTKTTQSNLRDCMTDCLQNLMPSGVGRCRSIIKSTTGDDCELVDKRSDDEAIQSEDMTGYQYFNRPSWYLGRSSNRCYKKITQMAQSKSDNRHIRRLCGLVCNILADLFT